jgi:hypothetical protein
LNLSNTYAGWTKQHWVRTHDSILNSADMGFSLDIGDYTFFPNGAGVALQCTPRRDLGNWALHGAQVVFFWFNL